MVTESQYALACCHLLAKLYKCNVSEDASEWCINNWSECIKAFSKRSNIRIKTNKNINVSTLKKQQLPVIFQCKSGLFYVLAKISDTQALLQDPFSDNHDIISLDELSSRWSGIVISFKIPSTKFNIAWFIPEFLRHKRILMEVLFLSLVLQLMGLLSPLLFQVVMDKVLVHNALSTLDVLAVVLIVSGIAEVLTKGFREYLFSHTTNKIDVHLGMKVLRHTLGLPLAWFKHRQTGTIISRILELDTIRDFLTGTSLTLTVDILFSFVFFAVMFFISPLLTCFFLLTLPLYIFLAFISQSRIHARTELQYLTSAVNTAFMNESISGAETIKSLAIEPVMANRCESQIADVTEATNKLQRLNTIVGQSVVFIQRLSTVFVIWVGSYQVLALHLSVGELIAFNMLLSQVLQPISGFVDYFQKYVQARVGINNLDDILNTPTETEGDQDFPVQPFSGDIKFDNIIFRYRTDLPPVLNGISAHIRAGERVGIVGPSGSGKSTLGRLIQKLYLPERGGVSIDNIPLNYIPADYLRGQIGVVLQENYLFNMSVRQNIALSDPSATFDSVVRAAQLAGADEFIRRLPLGYDTILAEAGRSLSGGQRQRIAIARALLTDPKILILDEATSALDEESQSIIQQNMDDIARGRTVIIIAHRLSTIRQCDRILVIEKGNISETGTHQELLSAGGSYSRLHTLQMAYGTEEKKT